MIKLPRMEWRLECGAIGYPELVCVFWLNAPEVEDAARSGDVRPSEAAPTKPGAPWDQKAYRSMGQALLRVEVPGSLTDSGEDERIEVGNGEALWRLEHRKDFDPQIVLWALRQYAGRRAERLEVELKN